MNRAERCRAGLCAVILVASGPAVGDGTPEPELIEFLGAWETEDGRWIDPIDLLDAKELDGSSKRTRGGPSARSGKPADDPNDRHEVDEDED